MKTTTIKPKINSKITLGFDIPAVTYSRHTFYIPNTALDAIKSKSKITKKSLSKIVTELIFENTNQPKHNLSKFILSNISKEEEKALDTRFQRNNKDWNESQENV